MSRIGRHRRAAHAEAQSWQGRYTALLDVMNAVLYAYGQGDQHRLAVAHKILRGMPRRNVAVEELDDRIVIYLEGERAAIDARPGGFLASLIAKLRALWGAK